MTVKSNIYFNINSSFTFVRNSIILYRYSNIQILQNSVSTKNSIAVVEGGEMEQQYLDNLEILPVEETTDTASEPKYDTQYFRNKMIKSNSTLFFNSTRKADTSRVIEVFVCEICSKQFKHEKSLLKHLAAKHNIELCDNSKKGTFTCKYCDKQYLTENFLKKHITCHGKSKR